MGQGWASGLAGLAGLATDFGVEVTDERPDEPPVEVDLRKRISLRKEAVRVSLEKKGIGGVRARVAVALDATGPMRRMYRDGVVAEIEAWTHGNVRMHEAVAADGTRVSLGGRNNEPQVIAESERLRHSSVNGPEAERSGRIAK